MTKNLSQATKDQIKDLIIQTVKKEKPETAKQLITLMQERHAIPPEQTASLIIELENEDRLHFTKQKPPTPASAKEYLFSRRAIWYWTTIVLAISYSNSCVHYPRHRLPHSLPALGARHHFRSVFARLRIHKSPVSG